MTFRFTCLYSWCLCYCILFISAFVNIAELCAFSEHLWCYINTVYCCTAAYCQWHWLSVADTLFWKGGQAQKVHGLSQHGRCLSTYEGQWRRQKFLPAGEQPWHYNLKRGTPYCDTETTIGRVNPALFSNTGFRFQSSPPIQHAFFVECAGIEFLPSEWLYTVSQKSTPLDNTLVVYRYTTLWIRKCYQIFT